MSPGTDSGLVRRGAARTRPRPGCSRRARDPDGARRPRHALLAEAVAGALLPGERAVLHERTAAMLESAGDDTLAAEAAGHWLAAGRPDRELPARVAAGRAAERVFGYAEAAAHFQRAIVLCRDLPDLGDLPAAAPCPEQAPPRTTTAQACPVCPGCTCGRSTR